MTGLGRLTGRLTALGTRGRIAILGGVALAVLATGSAVALTTSPAKPSARPVAVVAPGKTGAKVRTAARPPALTLAATTPAEHAQQVNGSAPVIIRFSRPLADGTPMPAVTPAIPGTWKRLSATAIQFTPATGFPAGSYVQVHVPAGADGIQGTGGSQLAASQVLYFHTGAYAPARLPQLLATLGYLPLTFTPTAGQAPPALGDAAAQLAAAYSPPAGTFTWQAGYPSQLMSFWDNGSPSGLIVHGAVMAFESDHNLTMDGQAGPAVWAALLRAASTSQLNQHGYSYAIASQVQPETLTVWHNGRVIMHTLANTGIPVAPTTVGTAPVYLRYQNQIMRGTNPDGSKYADPVSWVAYFRAGEAVHYFPRGSYGFQQSLGCVELPYAQAKSVWPYLTYGTLVTVTPR